MRRRGRIEPARLGRTSPAPVPAPPGSTTSRPPEHGHRGWTARRKLRHSGEHGGDNGRQPQSAAGAVRKTPAMARHEAPAFS